MKIAVVAPTHMPARRANTIQVAKMTQALCSLGHEVRLAAPGVRPGRLLDWDEWARLYGLQCRFPVGWLPALPPLHRYDYGVHAVGWARGWKADLLYTRLPQAAAVGSQVGMATIYEVHDYPYGGMGRMLLNIFLRGKGARRLVAITHSLANDLAGQFKAPNLNSLMLIAPDGVDINRYSNLPSPEEARLLLGQKAFGLTDRFTAGYSGHLYAGRGISLLLDIAAYLPEINLLVVGGEPDDIERLQGEVKTRGLENVLVAGFVPNADLPLYQACCEVLLAPYQEHVAASSGGDIARYLSPMKLFEYMASGRAILSSDLPVLREVLSEDNSVLLPAGDVQAWVAALRNLISQPERRAALGEAASRQALQYTWEARAKKIMNDIPER